MGALEMVGIPQHVNLTLMEYSFLLPEDATLDVDIEIHPSAHIKVTERLVIGEGARIGKDCRIEGRDVEIGRFFWMDEGAVIGGGSCFEKLSSFRAGDFLHMGRGSFINTARPVTIGDEVGLGMGTKVFTHGAYLSALDGFPASFLPVVIGDRVWIPGATLNPGSAIGSDTVIGVGSVVTGYIPERSLAVGSPAKVIKENVYPRVLDEDEWRFFWGEFFLAFGETYPVARDYLICGDTAFALLEKKIYGPVTDETERLRNQLRRYGIRFYSRPQGESYESWR